MPTVALSIGVAAVQIVSPNGDQLLDIFIQNLSANFVYVGSEFDLSTGSGIQIAKTTGAYVVERRKEPIWLVADGAASDVRVYYELYKKDEKP